MTDEGELIAGRYRLVSLVGTGAMGVVWQAHDELLDRIVAVKQLLLYSGVSEIEAEEANVRAMREGRIAARLHHPHAITVYDVAERAGKPCLIMEYLHSESLSAVLERRGPLPPEEVARIGNQIASALTAAHAAGIVHRDIKPANVLLAEDGTAKITDFGISRAIGDGTLTGTGILAGTPAYLAPEIAQGHGVGFPADVFSLGATLYAAVEGVPPFGLDDNALALLYRIATSEITPPKQSGPLTAVLAQMLEREVSQRLTMEQAHEALAVIADLPASPVPVSVEVPVAVPPPADDIKPRPRRLTTAITVAAVSLIAVGILLVAALTNDSTSTAGPISSPPSTTQEIEQSQPAPPSSSSSPREVTTEAAATSTPSPPSPPPDDVRPPDTPEQLRAAISDYYTLMPGNLEAGWTRLTADYQSNHAGGLAGYQAFWNPIQRVEIANISVTGPTRVSVRITYFYRDGRVIEEQTSFGLIAEDGIWKIGSSSVSSSRATQG